MAYVNLASATKLNRATQIVNAIGSGGFFQLYTTTPPANPDLPPTGTLLASLPLSLVPAVASYGILGGVVTAPGSNGSNGQYALAINGDGTDAAGFFTVSGGVLASITISEVGNGYTTPPTFDGFGTAGLVGATAVPVMTATIVFNDILTATAVAGGNAGWARVTDANNVGVIDFDVGPTNDFAVVMENTFVTQGGAVSCTAQILIEA